MFEQVFTGLGAMAALIPAVLWIIVSRAETPAPFRNIWRRGIDERVVASTLMQ
jgi:hypothetical protein